MTSLFCRHNRLTAKCPICSKELDAELRAKAPPRPAPGAAGAAAVLVLRARPAAAARTPGGVVTRRLARAADDGYRNPLVPGLRATADAERLAGALAAAAVRLEPPGPYEAVATEPDREQATWVAFLLALVGPDAPALQAAVAEAPPRWEDGEVPGPARAGTPAPSPPTGSGRERAGSQAAGFLGEADWTPQRRFARVFERLALPGIGARDPLRAARRARRRRPLPAARPTRSSSARRTTPRRRRPSGCCSPATACCSSAGRATWRRRPELPLEALDRGLAVWGTPGAHVDLAAELPGGRARRARLAMSAVSTLVERAPAGGPRPAADRAPARRRRVRDRHLVLGCLALAALAHRLPAAPTYDPWAWIVWGREITRLDLVTATGPSWKPLPVLFTTPFALAGDAWAPELWLVVAQAGGLLAFVFAYRLARAPRRPRRRACSPPAGCCSPAGSSSTSRAATPRGCSSRCACGRSSATSTGAAARRSCSAWPAGLLRPELWPFLLAYGLWLMWREPRRARLVVGCGALTLALWLLPEWWGSGDPLRAAERARDPNPGSAAFAENPFMETFRRARGRAHAAGPARGGARAGRGGAPARPRCGWRSGRSRPLLMVAVAAMTQAGFAGNLRYVALPAALVCVLAGAGWTDLVRALARRAGPVAAARGRRGAARWPRCPPSARPATRCAPTSTVVRGGVRPLRRARRRPSRRPAGARPSCAAARCTPRTSSRRRSPGRWHVHADEVRILPAPPGTAVARPPRALGRDPRFRPSRPRPLDRGAQLRRRGDALT